LFEVEDQYLTAGVLRCLARTIYTSALCHDGKLMNRIVNGNGRIGFAGLMAVARAGFAQAQTAARYPSHAIRIVVPFATREFSRFFLNEVAKRTRVMRDAGIPQE
jgi:hypothetical protein